MSAMKVIIPVAVLTALSVLVARQGCRIKNEAYRTHLLLNEIAALKKDRMNVEAQCDREGSPALVARRASALKLALVHPMDPRERLFQPEAKPMQVVAVASSRPVRH